MKLTIIIIAIQLHLLINSGFAYNDVCNRMKFILINDQYQAQGMIIEEISWKATVSNLIKFTSSGQQLRNDRISENLCTCILYKLKLDHLITRIKMKTNSIKINIKLQYQRYNNIPLTLCKPQNPKMEHKPVKENPVEENPVEEKPVEENPVKEKPVEEKPVEEKPVEENPVKEKPVKEKQAEENAGEKNSNEETPVEEKSFEKKVAEENSVEGKPVEEKAVERDSIEETLPELKTTRDIQPEEKPIEYMILKGNKSKAFFKNIYDIYLIHKNTEKNQYEYIIDGILQNVTIDDFKK